MSSVLSHAGLAEHLGLIVRAFGFAQNISTSHEHPLTSIHQTPTRRHCGAVLRPFALYSTLRRHLQASAVWALRTLSMATGPLRFRTPHIEELPTTQTKQAPGFAWVAVTGSQEDPSKNWGTNNRKRARAAGLGQSDAQREALSAKQQRDVERRIKELNSDGSKDVQIPLPKRDAAAGGAGGSGVSRQGRTPNTKKILASGKTFAHYLDDEDAEISRTGKRDGDLDVRPSMPSLSYADTLAQSSTPDFGDEEEQEGIVPLSTSAELEALLNASPLTFTQARSAAPPVDAPPPRRFCEVCGYFGRARCLKCGAMTCSVLCKDTHDEHRCLKFYA